MFISLLFSAFAIAASFDASQIKFLPVHFTPGQKQIVEERLHKAKPRLDLPDNYEIPKTFLSEVKDQGRRPTCVYFATLAQLESYYLSQSKSLNLSEECLVGLRNWMFKDGNYSGQDKPEELPNAAGDWPRMVANTIVNNGVPTEGKYQQMDCRYESAGSDKFINSSNYSDIFTGNNVYAYGKNINFDLDKDVTVDKIREMIANNIPVQVATLVYKYNLDSSNWEYNSFEASPDKLAGGHAILLTGYWKWGDRVKFQFKNSWGTWWGAKGYGSIDDRLLKHSWESDPEYDFLLSVHD